LKLNKNPFAGDQSDFDYLLKKIEKLSKNNSDNILLRICEMLKQEVFHYDWVGFYILNKESNELMLGPFVGKPTQHTRIAVGKGVCGQVAISSRTIVVQDVTQIDNYISCGLEVQSEIVVPVLKDGIFVAELDIDSHSPAPFTKNDEEFLKQICQLVSDYF
jgi:L-methionine (R)-S-oxide reductase